MNTGAPNKCRLPHLVFAQASKPCYFTAQCSPMLEILLCWLIAPIRLNPALVMIQLVAQITAFRNADVHKHRYDLDGRRWRASAFECNVELPHGPFLTHVFFSQQQHHCVQQQQQQKDTFKVLPTFPNTKHTIHACLGVTHAPEPRFLLPSQDLIDFQNNFTAELCRYATMEAIAMICLYSHLSTPLSP